VRSISIRPKIRFILIPTLFYAALAVIFALPVLLKGGNYLLGSDDSAGLNLWVVWWPLHAIPGNYNLVNNNYALFPIFTNVLAQLSLPTSLLYWALRPAFGPITAFNLILPVYCTLNGLCSFLFFRGRLLNFGRALLGGALVAFNPLTYELAYHGNISLLQFFVFPLWILLWERFLVKRDAVHGILLGLGSYFVVLTSLQAWPLALTFLLPYVLFTINRRHDWKQLIDPALWGVLLLCILFLIFPASSLIWAANLPTLGGTLAIWQAVNFPPLLFWIFIAALVIGSFYALRGQAISSMLRLAGIAIAGICVLSYLLPQLSPLTVLGITSTNDQVRPLILWLPVIAIGVLLILTNTPSTLLIGRGRGIRNGVLGLCLLAISGWWQFLPSVVVPYLKTYDSIANDPEDYVVADFPAGIDTLRGRYLSLQGQQADSVGSLGSADTAGRILMSVPFHQKRVIGGLTSRLNAGDLTAYENSPLLQLLTAQQLNGNPQDEAEKMRNDAVRWRIGYIFAHREQLTTDLLTSFHQWMAWINAYCLIGVENSTEVWQARWNPRGCPPEVLHLGTTDSKLLLQTGWYGEELSGNLPIRWTGKQPTSSLSFWVTPSSDYRFTFRVSAPQSENQTLTVAANGTELGTVTLQKDWQDYSFTVPRQLITKTDGLVSIELKHDHLDSVQGRELSAAYDIISIEGMAP
jgi:hypothetical protein